MTTRGVFMTDQWTGWSWFSTSLRSWTLHTDTMATHNIRQTHSQTPWNEYTAVANEWHNKQKCSAHYACILDFYVLYVLIVRNWQMFMIIKYTYICCCTLTATYTIEVIAHYSTKWFYTNMLCYDIFICFFTVTILIERGCINSILCTSCLNELISDDVVMWMDVGIRQVHHVCTCCTAGTLASDNVNNAELDISSRLLFERVEKLCYIVTYWK